MKKARLYILSFLCLFFIALFTGPVTAQPNDWRNINHQKGPAKLKWQMLPKGMHGIKKEALGPANAEQNIVRMNDGSIYCMYRTISGHPAEAYSRNLGKSWALPQIPEYASGEKIKNPRACPRIRKCKNGKYLFWHHNHGGWDFTGRNPAWISGGIKPKNLPNLSIPSLNYFQPASSAGHQIGGHKHSRRGRLYFNLA